MQNYGITLRACKHADTNANTVNAAYNKYSLELITVISKIVELPKAENSL